jgi:hypothetical protein
MFVMADTLKKIPQPSTDEKKPEHHNSEQIARKALQNGMKSMSRKLSKDGFQVKK